MHDHAMHPAPYPPHQVTDHSTGRGRPTAPADRRACTTFSRVCLLILASCLSAGLTSCTVASGNATAGTWNVKSVGGDVGEITPGGMKRMNNSAALTKAADTVKGMFSNYLMAEGLKYLGGKYYDSKNAEISASQGVKLEKLKNAKSVTDAEAALKAAQEARLAEEAGAALTPASDGAFNPL